MESDQAGHKLTTMQLWNAGSLSMRDIAERNFYSKVSTSTCSSETGVPQSRVKMILKKKHLRMRPYPTWLWPELKSMVYRRPPANMLDLRRKITEVLRSLVPENSRNASRGVLHCLQIVMEQGGGHIEHLSNQ